MKRTFTIIVLFVSFLSYSQIPESYLPAQATKKVKYLKASDVGLVSVESAEITPPFTAQEYADAYNNGINISNAVISAYNEGYSGIELEKGIYPLTGNRGTTTEQAGSNGFAIHIAGVRNFDLNFAGSTLFVLYDSNNRNPYDSTAEPIHELPFKLMNFKDVSHIKIRNLEIRGDNYMRSWVAGEEQDIGCYGITLSVNCQFVEVKNYEGHGFRCEPLAISFKGYSDLNLTWNSGGIDGSGNDIVEAGSYTTPMIDLSPLTIADNSVSIVGWGYTREIQFRKSQVKIHYYDATDTYINSEWTIQNKLNYLPENCTKVRVTAYGDERTDPTVSYNNCSITSGTPRNLIVEHCKFYNNMRGCIAGSSNNTTIRNNVFHTIGDEITKKFGWLAYGDTTKFAIDIEDGMPDYICIENNRFENVGHALLTPACQTLIFKKNLCQNIRWDSSIINCKYADISGNIFRGNDDEGGGMSIQNSLTFSERTTKITNNLFEKSHLIATVVNNKNNVCYVNGNTFLDSKVELEGNIFNGLNYHYDYDKAYQTVIDADVVQFNDYIEEKDGQSTWKLYNIKASDKKSKAVLKVNSNNTRLGLLDGQVPSMTFKADTLRTITTPWNNAAVITQTYSGVDYENINIYYGSGVATDTLPDVTLNFNKVNFTNSQFSLGRRTNTDANVMTMNFNDCTFDVSDLVNLRLLNNSYSNVGGQLVLNFNRCKFVSDTAKTLNVTSGTAIVGLAINFTKCETQNVTFNYAVTPTLKYSIDDVNCPSYADNATALAALGEGWRYKNTTSGEFETTHL